MLEKELLSAFQSCGIMRTYSKWYHVMVSRYHFETYKTLLGQGG